MIRRASTLTSLVLLTLCLVAPSAAGADDRDAVERAVMDYVEAVEQGKPELIERGVHTDLAKIGFYRQAPGAGYQLAPMTFDELRELAATFKDKGYVPENPEHSIEILDMLDATASVKLTAFWGIDYMQLGKFDGEWKIIHVLWQSHPE